ncbi:MAG: hypothetical protein KAU58_06090 [Candidatus Omnitrophica bacterium]|nr:hypothetical protein [Candidatus Omnitrophota bacterium]
MKKINVLAIVPIRERNLRLPKSLKKIKGKPLVDYTISHAKKSKYINKIIVSTNSDKVINHVKKLGITIPFKRPKYLNGKNIILDEVLCHTTKWVIDNTNFSPDLIVLLEITHPFRKVSLIDQAIEALIKKNLDTVFISYEDHRNYWKVTPDNTLERIGESEYIPRERHSPIYREVSGVTCVTKPDFILKGSRLGEKVGMIPVRDARTVFDIRDEETILT